MRKKAQKAEQKETRGRKMSMRPIGKNGLFKDQWERILTDANSQGYGSGIVLLRQIIQEHYDRVDLLKAQEEYAHQDEFKKLPTQTQNKIK